MLEWWQYTLLALAGAAGGFIDAIAGGGGLITVPALLWARLPPQLTLGTNKLQSSCGTMLAVFRYTRAGLIRWRTLRLAVVVTFIAAALRKTRKLQGVVLQAEGEINGFFLGDSAAGEWMLAPP